MSSCTFFGHRDCFHLDTDVLRSAIEGLIEKGVDTFYVGNHGRFDSAVLVCLRSLKKEYTHIGYFVVLAYLPTKKSEYHLYADCSIYPEGLEVGLPQFAIERRNRWMIDQSDYCLCYVTHTGGGAYKFARIASHRGLSVINLGETEL